MKDIRKLFNIIIVAVIIGFAAAGCGNVKDDPDTPTPTVTGVTVSPASTSVAKGATRSFTATVSVTNNAAKTVTWAIVQTNKNAGTTINASGLLTIAAAETLTTLTVKATSTVDNTKSGTATVTVTNAGENIFTGETLTSSSNEQETRKVNGYDYELWNQNKQGTTSMTIGNGENGGTFKCSWSGILNVLFRAGRKFNQTQTHSQIGTISIEYNASAFSITGDVGYLSVYGWVTGGSPDELIEYYIVERRGNYNPGASGPSSVNMGTATIDGGTYTFYVTTRTNQPSIQGTKTFKQYWSIRNSNRTSGTISVSEHFNKWAALAAVSGTTMTSISNGKMYEVALKVEGYNNNGSAEINKNILSINGVPIQ
jgi:endo-1,4-beta-xylanase